MARSIDQIQQQILDDVAADTTLGPLLTSTSRRAIYRLWSYIQAVAINLLEQLMDIFTLYVENVAATAAPATPAWLQAQIFKFQYSSTNPQVIQFTDFAPGYPVVDETLRIVTRCSVNTTLSNSVEIKVAKSDTPESLSTPELNALKAYINPPNGIGIAGVSYNITSGNSDKLFVQGNVYFQGEFSSVISTNVVAAIDAFLSALPFNGQMKISDLEDTIRNVAGVNDVLLTNVSARADATAFGSGTYLILNQQTISRLWNTVAGYMIGETTSGQTFADQLTFIAE